MGDDANVEVIQITDEDDDDNDTSTTNSSVSVTKRKSAVWSFFSIKDISKRDWVTCDICQTTVKTKDSGK